MAGLAQVAHVQPQLALAAIRRKLPFERAAAAGRLQGHIGLRRLPGNVVTGLPLQGAATAAQHDAREIGYLLVPAALHGDFVKVQQGGVVAPANRLKGRLENNGCAGQRCWLPGLWRRGGLAVCFLGREGLCSAGPEQIGLHLNHALQGRSLRRAVQGCGVELLQLPLPLPALRCPILALAGDAPAWLAGWGQLPIKRLQLQVAVVVAQLARQGVQRQALLVDGASFGIAGVQGGLPGRVAQKGQCLHQCVLGVVGVLGVLCRIACVVFGQMRCACLRRRCHSLQLQLALQQGVWRPGRKGLQVEVLPLRLRLAQHVLLPGVKGGFQLQQGSGRGVGGWACSGCWRRRRCRRRCRRRIWCR